MDDEAVPGEGSAVAEVPEDFALVFDTIHRDILTWSAGARRLLGYRAQEVVGTRFGDLLAVELPSSARNLLTAGRPWTSRMALRHRNGNRVLARLRGTPLAGADGNSAWLLTAAPTAYASGPTSEGSSALWDRTLAQLPLPVAVYDLDARFVDCNEAMSSSMGLTQEQMRGRTLWEIAPRHPTEEIDQLQRDVLRTGEAVCRERAPSRAAGELSDHAWSIFVTPLKDGAGAVQGLSALVIDTTEQYWARRRLAVVNNASVRIGSTLDVVTTAQELVAVTVEAFADFVTVDLLESVALGEEPERLSCAEPVVVRRTAQGSVLPGCPEAVLQVGTTAVYPPASPPVQALSSGRATRHRIGDQPLEQWITASPDRARSVRQHGVHSVMMVPLRARGATLGMAHFLRHRTPQAFGRDDLVLAEEIAARAAVSIDNARRYTRERRTALALQRSLLPEQLPSLVAADLAGRYLPTGQASEVGGDWFDAIPLSGARIALVVGDVAGHGVRASATMGRLRTAVRTLADLDLPPDELLTQLDDLVLRLDREEGPDARARADEASGEVGATCLYAVYDPVTRRCQLARAGHPPPALVSPDGTVRLLDLPAGPPLGLGGLPFEAAEIEFDEGSLLALFTDGLIETAERDVDTGLGLLCDALGGPAAPLEETCDRVLRKVRPDPPTDDIVLLMARTRAIDSDRVHTWHLPLDPAAVSRARLAASGQVAAWNLEELAFTTELIVSELVTNAIRYGHDPIQLRMICGDALLVEVSDGNSAAPHLRRARTFDEGGRGLLLVAQLAERWGSRQTPSGKTIWAEQPFPAG